MGRARAFALAFATIVAADAAVGLLALPPTVDALIVGAAVAGAYGVSERLGWTGWTRRGRAPLDPGRPPRGD